MKKKNSLSWYNRQPWESQEDHIDRTTDANDQIDYWNN